MTKERDNKLSMFTPFSARWNSAPILFMCKNCKHEYLVDIASRGYTFMDIATKRSENSKKFWKEEFKCPKCKNYSPPMVLVFEPNPDGDKWKQWMEPISADKEKLWNDMKKVDTASKIIFDDTRMLLPNKLPPSDNLKRIFKLMEQTNKKNIKIKWTKHKDK